MVVLYIARWFCVCIRDKVIDTKKYIVWRYCFGSLICSQNVHFMFVEYLNGFEYNEIKKSA